jgi:hypothetical protein
VDPSDRRLTGGVGSERPSKANRCDFCRDELSTVQEFIYHVESFNFEIDPVRLEIIRRIPRYLGEPLRLCQDCRASLEVNVREKAEENAAITRSDALGRRLLLWLLVVPLGLWMTSYAVVEIIHKLW